MQQNHFVPSWALSISARGNWIHFCRCFNVDLLNTIGKARGLLFSIDLTQQFGLSSAQQVLPSCVGLWMKCHLSTKLCLIVISFLLLVLAFQGNIFFGTLLIMSIAVHRACFRCVCKGVTDFSLCFSIIPASALPGCLKRYWLLMGTSAELYHKEALRVSTIIIVKGCSQMQDTSWVFILS